MRNLPKLNTTAKESALLGSLEQLVLDVISHEQFLVDELSCLNRNRSSFSATLVSTSSSCEHAANNIGTRRQAITLE